MKEELKILIKAQYPLIYLLTPEEDRAEAAIAQLASDTQQQVYTWTSTQGLRSYQDTIEGNQSSQSASTMAPQMAIQAVIRDRDPALFIFKDLHPFLESAEVIRYLRDAITAIKDTHKSIILISPVQNIPSELEKDTVLLDFPIPDMEELGVVLQAQRDALGKAPLSEKSQEKLIKATLGLTIDEAKKVYRKALVMTGHLTEAEVRIILSEKKQLIRRNGILDFVEEFEEDDTFNSIGGLEELKHWLKQRSNAFTERARIYGLRQPKGMLILGVPGCGKSLIAKTTSRFWGSTPTTPRYGPSLRWLNRGSFRGKSSQCPQNRRIHFARHSIYR